MIRYLQLLSVTCIFLTLLVAGCGRKEKAAPPVRDPELAVTCIGVMPVKTAVDYESALSFSQAKQLKDGARILDILLRKKYGANKEFRFVSPSQVYSIENSEERMTFSTVKAVADQLSCNVMLEMSVERYSDRVGGEYTAKEPASVAFTYKLSDVNQEKILCQGRFDEVQQSLMENLYNWSRARQRGFTWVTAEELIREGVEEKFSQCPYLGEE